MDTRSADPLSFVPARILVVEDEQIVALELKDRILRMGHSVVGVAASGEAAIDEARVLRPDLILMDIKLQGALDGIEAATALRRDGIDAAVVFLTAFADDETLHRAKVTQPYGYILKPFHERELHVVIEVSLYRQRTERALRDSEVWRDGLLRSVGDPVVASDPGGRVKVMNPRAEALTGWSGAEAIGRPLAEVCHFAQRNERRSGTWRGGERNNLLRKDGVEVPIELESTPIRTADNDTVMGTVCVFRDVSERLRQRDRQRFLAYASTDLASSLDIDEVLTRVASLIAQRQAGWCVIHLANKHGNLEVGAFAHRDAATHAAVSTLVGSAVRGTDAVVAKVVRAGVPMLEPDLTGRDWATGAVGIERPLPADLLAASAIIAPLRARDRCLGTLMVVAERRDGPLGAEEMPLIEELARRMASSIDNAQLYADARRATAMRDEVLAIVSHDLRSPLSTINLMAEQLLVASEHKPQRIEAIAQSIQGAALRMKRLIDDLVDVGRVDAGQLSIELGRVSTRAIVTEALSTFEDAAAKRSIRVECGSVAPAEVLCDHGRVLQVLSNLIGNAVKFSREGSTIRVLGAARGGWFAFSVTDQGAGIAPDQLDRVFERYWQAPEAKSRGSGLGLYIARGIVEAHGGQIWAESRVAEGSTFHFTIPIAATSEHQLGAPP